ncbi:hypothetical protein L211DRAFT_845316 [Terfezia boudieri ATCC MYA-4762]|uniref:Uncharacterized protein n=1 Tax=Terfezia boudieri ATCC MYA-4762 TaxID=1051890 RepID=A0A3N4MHW6_9PEZI|nr:hypothetical protein L211DRAFT_845316 [Terfezia boudieri ATCC MYA-4762]
MAKYPIWIYLALAENSILLSSTYLAGLVANAHSKNSPRLGPGSGHAQSKPKSITYATVQFHTCIARAGHTEFEYQHLMPINRGALEKMTHRRLPKDAGVIMSFQKDYPQQCLAFKLPGCPNPSDVQESRISERMMQDADDQTGYKGKDDEFYKKCYHCENKTDKIAEYYKAMAESDARRDKEEKRRQKEL